jgi:hypothetical protein
MDRLEDTSLVGGERADATDHCLAGIVRLSNEVRDAASYIPTYDQRVYAEVGILKMLMASSMLIIARPSKHYRTN